VFADAKPPFRCDVCGRPVDVVLANGATNGERAIASHRPVTKAAPTLAALEQLRQLLNVEVVEVPVAAYDAALELLRDFFAIGDRERNSCGLCEMVPNEEGPGYYPLHTDACPVGRARTVAEALDYTDPPAQARALAQLAREASR
jgi:hypothetical protein